MRAKRRASGDLEAAILAVLWAAGRPLTPAQTREGLGTDLAYNTVMTTLVRLHEKGAVQRERVGRAYAYLPATDVVANAAEQMRRLLDRADHAAVLAHFVDNLDEADGRILRGLLSSITRRR